MAKLAADTYGEALFSLAVEENKGDRLFEETEALKAILDQNPDFNVVMNHPKITRDQKEKMIEEVFHGRVSDEITGFLRLLLQKERYKELDAILAFFSARVKEYKGIGVAYVTTAVPLKDAQKAADFVNAIIPKNKGEAVEGNKPATPTLLPVNGGGTQ